MKSASTIFALLILVGCATTSKHPTVDALSGRWVGEWNWKGPDSTRLNSGQATVIFKRLDAKTWNVDISAPGSYIPNERIVLNVDQIGPTELSGEYQGASFKTTLGQEAGKTTVKVEIKHPQTAINGQGTLGGGIIRIAYTETAEKGSGTITLERKGD